MLDTRDTIKTQSLPFGKLKIKCFLEREVCLEYKETERQIYKNSVLPHFVDFCLAQPCTMQMSHICNLRFLVATFFKIRKVKLILKTFSLT